MTQFTIPCAVELMTLVTSDDNNDVIVEKVINIDPKITSSNRYGVCLVSFQIVDRIRRQSS